jgi:hypothetical protein
LQEKEREHIMLYRSSRKKEFVTAGSEQIVEKTGCEISLLIS